MKYVIGLFDDNALARIAEQKVSDCGRVEHLYGRESNTYSKLRGYGLNGSDLDGFAEGVRRGGTLVIVHCDDKNARRVADIFRGLPSVDINRRMARWGTSGFKGYDEKASFYSDEDITRERELGRSELHVPVIEETIAVGQAKVFETIRDTTKKTEVEVKPIAGEARTSRSSLDRMSAERVSRSSQI